MCKWSLQLLLELLNKVCDLGLLEILLIRTSDICGFGFCEWTVLVASSGNQVSCYTTVGGGQFFPKGETTWSFEFCFCLSKNSLNGSLPAWVGVTWKLSDLVARLALPAFSSRNFLKGSWPVGVGWTSAVGSDLVCCWGCGISGLNLTSVLLLSPLKIEKSPIAAAITAKSTTRFFNFRHQFFFAKWVAQCDAC